MPSLRNGLLTHIDRYFWFDAGAPGNPVTLCGADQDPGAHSHLQHEDFHPNYFPGISSSVVDPCLSPLDPDPAIFVLEDANN